MQNYTVGKMFNGHAEMELDVRMGLDARKPDFGGFANNKGADQPAHTHSLISAFIVGLTKSIMSRHSSSEISMF